MKKLILAAILIPAAVLGQDHRFYDQDGNYRGRIEQDPSNGGYRFYDQDGNYRERSEPDYNGGFRYYDQDGNYEGRDEPQE